MDGFWFFRRLGKQKFPIPFCVAVARAQLRPWHMSVVKVRVAMICVYTQKRDRACFGWNQCCMAHQLLRAMLIMFGWDSPEFHGARWSVHRVIFMHTQSPSVPMLRKFEQFTSPASDVHLATCLMRRIRFFGSDTAHHVQHWSTYVTFRHLWAHKHCLAEVS